MKVKHIKRKAQREKFIYKNRSLVKVIKNLRQCQAGTAEEDKTTTASNFESFSLEIENK